MYTTVQVRSEFEKFAYIAMYAAYLELWCSLYTGLDGGRYGRDCMVVGFITTYAISAYHH